ncbi:TetR/AcrR family transcriptional regulator (plasmid) [Methylobacterium sp. NMS14P]|uniref:TetR/AcrR family transcriptional regulator n=1 Tax=unclassified Methylobacterium TaxID=2615210 RepID=UPI002359E1A6|nr:TetR/AcrR family transcriptional regulator [Methylobacterium sp. NMS14P]WCS28557.1 TetR/AcrR family transcriptional regulator [Methylobacterium sp. NMS14P]
MAATLKRDVREAILVAAREAAMAYGYGGINFRDLAEAVGIKAASINYYFANKAILGEAVARRYWEDIARDLEAISTNAQSPMEALRQYPRIFRLSLERNNRMCLSSFMATEYDVLPEQVLKEVQAFADVNTAWLREQLVAAKLAKPKDSETRARAIYAAIAGAQIIARSRSDINLFDSLVRSYQDAGLLPN